MADEQAWTPVTEARHLLRAARMGSLATQHEGQPGVSLCTPATAPDLSILLWLSSLSPHTRHLRADPRCAVLVMGEPTETNPQTAPRLSVTGLAEVIVDPALKARWLAIHPYAALYSEFTDFALFRVHVLGGQLVGGFARAKWLSAEDLAPDPAAVAAVEAASEEIMAHCNADHPDALAAMARASGAWRMVAVDVDGCDLDQNEIVRRVHWPEPVSDADGVRNALIVLARAARA